MNDVRGIEYSFIILTFNSERYISQCLQSLNETADAINRAIEVFIVDNGSADQTRTIIERHIFNPLITFHFIKYADNTGTTFSRNQGLKKAVGNYIVVMDSDAYMNPETLLGMTNYLNEHPQCGMAVPLLTYPDGRFQLSTDQFPTFVRKVQRYFYLKEIEKAAVEENTDRDVDYAISACWVMPKSVVDTVGLLDEKIFYAPEDVDYCIRIWLQGFSIRYLPQYKMVHDAQEISRANGFKINLFTLSHIKGLAYLYFKHRFLFSGKKFRSHYKRLQQAAEKSS